MEDARLTGTQKLFSRRSSSTSPPKMPLPCESTPTSATSHQVLGDPSAVNPSRKGVATSTGPARASAASASAAAGVATICSSTK